MAITSAINDFFSSIYELLASIFSTIYAVIHSVFSAILGFVQGFFNLIGDVVTGLVDVAGGVGKFVAGNAAILAVGALGAFAYVKYTAQGQRVASNKKIQ
ncbi:hypothetical protein FZEAL_9329 [Fusarium zealandicum]|uniref:Uncharacterized protein n=1 Tax=Fusarium zealandicum TaxID=1053134 RepID=A0A8H4UBP2_9HYPO|nr:hypothetical protein FZEAL_9329 [Fusarium zealandicum]